MTRKEFSTKSAANRRIEGWYYFACIGVLFAAPVFGLFARLYSNNHGTTFNSAASMSWSFTILACLSGMAFLPRYLARRHGLICPTCNKPFIYEHVSATLLTGNCSRCGTKVFDDGPVAFGEFRIKDWFTKEQFKARIEGRNRHFKRREVVLVTAGFVLVLVFLPLGFYLSALLEKGRLDPWLTLRTLGWVVSIMLGTPVLLYFGLFLFAVTKKQKRPDLPCPECGRSIVGYAAMAALEKNICIYCGTRLFEASPAANA